MILFQYPVSVFITLEGLDGSGKTTLARGLQRLLEEVGQEVVLTREPGATKLGKQVRSLILEQDEISTLAELFLFLADRAEHVSTLIKPALDRGAWVICDRHADSTVVYQGYGRGLDLELLRNQNRVATAGMRPDLTLLLDIDPELSLKRQVEQNRLGTQPLSFYQRIRQGFLDEAAREPDRWSILDATCDASQLQSMAWANIQDRLPPRAV